MTVLTVVSQNVDHDGPAPRATLVLTQESSVAIVRGSLPGYRVEVGHNPQLVTAWTYGIGFQRAYTVPIHPSGQAMGRHFADGFTPRRDLFVTEHNGPTTGLWASVNTHWINSAWAPLWKRTSYRRARRQLWRVALKVLRATLRSLHARGFVVILGGDLNRLGRWRIPGMRDVFGHGLGRIWITRSKRIKAVSTHLGAKVGDGRVTHRANHATLLLRP